MNNNRAKTILAAIGVILAAALLIKGRGKSLSWYRNLPRMAARKLSAASKRGLTQAADRKVPLARSVQEFFIQRTQRRVRKAVPDPFWSEALLASGLSMPAFRLNRKMGSLELVPLRVSLTRQQSHLLPQFATALACKEVMQNFFGTRYETDSQGFQVAVVRGIRLRMETMESYYLLWEMFEQRPYEYDPGQPYVVWDVGMNAGLASLSFAATENVKKVFGFEPFPRTFAAALHNFSLNPALSAKILPFNQAIGDAEESLVAVDNQGQRGSNSLRWENEHAASDEEVAVAVRDASAVLQEIAAQSGGLPIVCKLDAEGAEYAILPALARAGLLREISVFLMEYHREGSETLTALLQEAGFRVVAAPSGPGSQVGSLYAARPGLPFPKVHS